MKKVSKWIIFLLVFICSIVIQKIVESHFSITGIKDEKRIVIERSTDKDLNRGIFKLTGSRKLTRKSIRPFIQTSDAFQVSVHPGQSISFEYFLNNFYETIILIRENNAEVHKNNVDSKSHDIFNGGLNSSAFEITWSVNIIFKEVRGPGYPWGPCPITVIADDKHGNIQFVSKNKGGTYVPSKQNALVNVTIK